MPYTEGEPASRFSFSKKIILHAFGSPDIRQIDGLGGADPLTSKVAYVGPSTICDADLNYTFGYVGIGQPVSWIAMIYLAKMQRRTKRQRRA